MKNKIILIGINKLKSHEEVNKNHLDKLFIKIQGDDYLKNPVVVEDKHFVILDGHHRVTVLKKLKAKKIPCQIVNYQTVRVYLRRKNYQIKDIRSKVIERAISKNLFPYKTTRHFIKDRVRNINFHLEKLL